MNKSANNRTSNSIRNVKFAIIGQIFSIVLSFTSRTFFVYLLGKEYLGINGLFSNILAILSLAEMGIGSAIIYSLYKPLADNNVSMIRALMHLFKKVYCGIGVFIIVGGCSLIPFLDFFVKERPSVDYFVLIYVLFVLNNASGYFFSYKGMIINADQKQYITTTITQLSTLVMSLAQIACLLLFRNYIIYLIIMLVSTLGRNIVISIYADKLFPFLREKTHEKLPNEERNEIVKNVKAMMMHRIGGVIVDCTDNILLSKLVSVLVVGMYSNYYLLTHTLAQLYNLIFNALIASVGNLGVTKDKSIIYRNFRIIDFAGMWLYYFSFICLFNLIDPFICLWLGEDYTLGFWLTFVICLNYYFTGMRNSLLTFRSALGLFWYDRYKAVAEAIVNLVVSIILGKMLGAIGIFIGTATSTIGVCLMIEPHIVYKYAFGKSSGEYYIRYFLNFVLSLSMAFLVKFLSGMLVYSNVLNFIISFAICVSLPNIVYICIFRRSAEFKSVFGIFSQRFLKIRVRN